jgi:multiple sugar transport system permease protein/cellobiose transport system permease protein
MKVRISFSYAIVFVFIICMTILSVIPFYFMIITGTYVNEAIYTGIKLLPGGYFLKNLHTVMSTNFMLFYKNSLIVALAATIGVMATSCLAGFAFAKMKFPGKNALFLFVLGTIMIPNQMGLVGLAIEMRTFRFINTHLALILPSLANAFGVFWMKQYIESSVPNEILESANIDGCNMLTAFIRIVLPISRSALITLFLFYFLWAWNDYLVPLVMINNQDLYTIPLAIAILGQLHRTDYAARILALTLATIPVLIIFSFGSKYLIRGMVAGSLKG